MCIFIHVFKAFHTRVVGCDELKSFIPFQIISNFQEVRILCFQFFENRNSNSARRLLILNAAALT